MTDYECYLLETFVSDQQVKYDIENEAAILVQRIWRGHHGSNVLQLLKAHNILLKDCALADRRKKYDVSVAKSIEIEGQKTMEEWIKRRRILEEEDEKKKIKQRMNESFIVRFITSGGLHCNNTNKLTIRYYTNDSTSVNLNSSSAITDTNWHHFFAQRNGNSFDIFIDGSLDASGTTSGSHGSVQTTTSKLFIGAREYAGANRDPFNGSIANVGIWNRALSSSEIESIYWKGQYEDLKNTELTNLVSWYNLKDTGYGSAVASVPEGGNGSFAYSNGTWTFASNVTYTYDNSFTQGLRYRLTYTIATYTSGSINVSFSNGTDQGTERSAVGTYTEENEISSNANWYFNPDNFVGTITNVTLEEVIAPDSTATNNGSIYGATTLTDAYSASSPFLPRIQDKASDVVANYGEVYGGNAVSFDGASDYISVADSSDLELGTSDFSFSFWMNLDDVSGTQTIFNRRKDGSNSHWIQVKNTGY